MCRHLCLGLSGLMLVLASGAQSDAQWTLSKITTLRGFAAPESVAVDSAGGMAYVSNIAPLKGEDGQPRYWEDDGGGFISRIQFDAAQETFDVEMRWIADTSKHPVHKPKGLCLFRNLLLANDNTRVIAFPLDRSRPRRFSYEDAGKLNDIVVHGNTVFSSDTENGVVHYRVFRSQEDICSRLPAAPAVNGVTWAGGKFYCVSWELHEIYELSADLENPGEPRPLGLAEHFQSLDSIEGLDDGSLLVTDFHGGKICVVAPDRKTVTTLAEMQTPADVGLDRANGLLFVPSVEGDIVNIYRLTRE